MWRIHRAVALVVASWLLLAHEAADDRRGGSAAGCQNRGGITEEGENEVGVKWKWDY